MAATLSLLAMLQSFCLSAHAATTTSTTEGILHTETVASTTAGDALSASPTSMSSMTPLTTPLNSQGCSYTSPLCPACNDSIFNVGEVGAFVFTCDTILSNVSYYVDVHPATPRQCIDACMESGFCLSPVISPDGTCLLASGNNPKVEYRSGWAVLEPRFTGGLPAPPGSAHLEPASSTTSHHISIHSSIDRTKTTILTAISSVVTSQCQASSISCPHCNGAFVKDAFGKTYHVFCDNQLFSQNNYAVQHYLTPGGCMAECDNFTGCKGSTYWEGGSCQLAKGEDVFPQEDPGYIAFLPVNSTYSPPAPVLSAYPTGPFTSAKSPSAKTTSSKTPAPSHLSSQRSKSSVTRTSATTSSLRTTWISTLKVTPSPAPTGGTHQVSCPSYDNVPVTDPTDGRHFDIQCDTGFGAGSKHHLCI